MSRIALLYLMFLSVSVSANKPDPHYYRSMIDAASRDMDTATAFYQSTRSIQDSSAALLLGYKAMAEMLMCRHLANPVSKLAYFRNGRRLLERAIQLDRGNAELRFMRFCTQNNTPALLQYNNDIETDKMFLIQYLKDESSKSATDHTFNRKVKGYLLESKYCTVNDKSRIGNL